MGNYPVIFMPGYKKYQFMRSKIVADRVYELKGTMLVYKRIILDTSN